MLNNLTVTIETGEETIVTEVHGLTDEQVEQWKAGKRRKAPRGSIVKFDVVEAR
jgi:hypothetical protein